MRTNEKRIVAQCVTCGSELHPERAEKYDYCLAPDCQRKNLKSLTLVAVGVNKSAEQYLLLDDQTRDDLAQGKFHDQRRGSFGTSVPSAASSTKTAPAATAPAATAPAATAPAATAPAGTTPAGTTPAATTPAGAARPSATRPTRPPPGRPP